MTPGETETLEHADGTVDEDDNKPEAIKDEPDDEGVEQPEGDEAEAEDTETEEADDDTSDDVEVEYEGQTYRLPPELKDAVLRHADYTRKTQGHAEEVRAFKAEQEAWQKSREADEALDEDITALRQADHVLKQYQEMDWRTLEAEDPMGYLQERQKYQEWQSYRNAKASEVQSKRAERDMTAQRDYAKRVDEAFAAVKRDIPGWSSDIGRQVREFAEANGVTGAQLAEINANAPLIKLLHKAFVGDTLQKQRPKPKAPDPKPLKQVTKGKGTPARVDPLSDKADVNTWMKAEQARMQKKGVRY